MPRAFDGPMPGRAESSSGGAVFKFTTPSTVLPPARARPLSTPTAKLNANATNNRARPVAIRRTTKSTTATKLCRREPETVAPKFYWRRRARPPSIASGPK